MKITLTGSIGNIGRPLTDKLVKNGHEVTVISSNIEKQKTIEDLGAMAAIGSITDLEFLIEIFTNADVVYVMVPPANYFDQNLDLVNYFIAIGENFAKAIKKTEVKKVINLSSIGAHLDSGNGILKGTFHVEKLLNDLPSDISITHIRPTEIFNNLLSQIYVAKSNGFIGSNIANNVINSWVSPIDIAHSVADEIENGIEGRTVKYVTSEELTYDELASILGVAIENTNLKWVQYTDEQMVAGLINVGFQTKIANEMAEMYQAINSGLLYEDYKRNKPVKYGEVKVKDFAIDFANAYKQL